MSSSRHRATSHSLTFLHTAPAHITTFTRLLYELNPRVPATHLVHAELLDEARRTGVTPLLEQHIAGIVSAAIADGARIVVCTCSTIGAYVERVPHNSSVGVMRIDRPMAEQAVDMGSRILVVAALASTLQPTKQLIVETAQRKEKTVSLQDVFCANAWPAFEQGDFPTYYTTIAKAIRETAPQGDVAILAQASMAGAAALCSDLRIPILSSPQLGLEAALAALLELQQQ